MAGEAAVLIAGTVMDMSAALLNDPNKSLYSYTVQLPFLNMALQELQEAYQQNNISVTDEMYTEINVASGITEIAYGANPTDLPPDLVEPQELWSRVDNTNPWMPINKVDTLPIYYDGIEINQILEYVWEDQKIKFLAANADNQIKIKGIKQLFAAMVDENSEINIINAASFLQYRTAALIAELIEENDVRARGLNNNAGLAMDRVISIGTKGRQPITYRRMPFRIGYKNRNYV